MLCDCRNVIFPRLMEFKPDMLMLSAGFDAHKKDTINAGYIALVMSIIVEITEDVGCSYGITRQVEEDYDWLTRNLMHIAHSCCNGRIVSVLEGNFIVCNRCTADPAKCVCFH